MLPDDVLLVVIEFTLKEGWVGWDSEMAMWVTLVHVCQRWRSVVFGSPRRLNLRLVCKTKTSMDTLDVWPAFPLAIEGPVWEKRGLIALLEQSELVPRISQIRLWNVYLEDKEAMSVPLPELTYLVLRHSGPKIPLSDSFLGGSAPRLQMLYLESISFPGLPKLLSSATHIASLHLLCIPDSGYISPEAMVTCLSVLTNLGLLSLEFESSRSHPNRESRRPPLSTRTVLPVLTDFSFKGHSEYLEDLVSSIDAPRLNRMFVKFYNYIVFDTPQFTRLICDISTFNAFHEARVYFGYTLAIINLSSKASGDRELNVEISSKELRRQVSFLEQVCTSSLSPLSTLEDLYIGEHPHSWPAWEDNIDNALWLELLHPFTMVKNLFVSEKIVPRVVPALQELVGGRTTEVLPTVQNVFIEKLQPSGHVWEGIGKFVAARQVTSHPIIVSHWDRDPSRRMPIRLGLFSGC